MPRTAGRIIKNGIDVCTLMGTVLEGEDEKDICCQFLEKHGDVHKNGRVYRGYISDLALGKTISKIIEKDTSYEDAKEPIEALLKLLSDNQIKIIGALKKPDEVLNFFEKLKGHTYASYDNMHLAVSIANGHDSFVTIDNRLIDRKKAIYKINFGKKTRKKVKILHPKELI